MPRGIYNRRSTEKRFWDKVTKTETCWVWTGCIVRRYGGFQIKGKLVKAHRMAWILAFGEIPFDVIVCHHCDNPLCVRPDHLFLGTHKTNAEDRERKGRGNPQKGERNGSAKLTEKQVRNLRHLRKTKGISYAKLGRLFGICTMQAYDIVNGINWSHVEED